MDSILLNSLKKHKIFSCLNNDQIHGVVEKFALVNLEPNTTLFEQGDAPNYVYLILGGRLSISIRNNKLQHETIDYADSGEMIGELAVLANQPYAYSCKTTCYTTVYQLPRNDFLKLCHQNASFMYETLHPVIVKSHNTTPTKENIIAQDSVLILPANELTAMQAFTDRLIPMILADKNFILVSDLLTDYQTHDVSLLHEKIRLVEQHKKSYQRIIYYTQSCDSPLATIALKRCETIYLVANALSQPFISQNVVKQYHIGYNINLILLHPTTTTMPKNTHLWLEKKTFLQHHHVRIDTEHHYARFMRFLRGEAIGLVLGGGGTRGWGHIGALKALKDQEQSIDYIGGTSVGSIIAGCYALTESYESTLEKFNTFFSVSKHSISWKRFTLPIVSLFDAKLFTDACLELFGYARIEDLWLPYFCISSNISRYSEDVHDQGFLWEKTRASSSIPGLIPPMVINGNIHFDGGLLNNLPVDIMWEKLRNKGHIIAVELNASMEDSRRYYFPPILPLRKAFTSQLKLTKEDYKFPGFLDIFLRGLLVGSYSKAKQNGINASILVNLNLRNFRLLQTNKKKATRMQEIGYEETSRQLIQYQNKKLAIFEETL